MESSLAEFEKKIQDAVQVIKDRHQGVALTGAGISTPSGIPDFRSPGSGLWERYHPMEVASLTAFQRDPEKFYDWIRPLADKMLSARPNPAHQALAKLEKHDRIQTVITQNIDTLHQKAGSEHVLEVHGSFETLSCLGCYRQSRAHADFVAKLSQQNSIPRCPACGGILKPDVVLFEEQLPAQTWNKASRASKRCNFMLVLGSSLTVTPVSHLPQEALDHGAALIIINQTETYLDHQARVTIHGDVAQILPKITKAVLND